MRTRNKEPRHRLRKNMKARSQEKANCVTPPVPLTRKPKRIRIGPMTIRIFGTLRHLDKSSGGVENAECGVIAKKWGVSAERNSAIQQIENLGYVSFSQTSSQVLGHVFDGAQMSQLEGAQVGDDGPAIFDDDVCTVRPHQVTAIGDYVKQFAIGHFDDAFVVEIGDDGH